MARTAAAVRVSHGALPPTRTQRSRDDSTRLDATWAAAELASLSTPVRSVDEHKGTMLSHCALVLVPIRRVDGAQQLLRGSQLAPRGRTAGASAVLLLLLQKGFLSAHRWR